MLLDIIVVVLADVSAMVIEVSDLAVTVVVLVTVPLYVVMISPLDIVSFLVIVADTFDETFSVIVLDIAIIVA